MNKVTEYGFSARRHNDFGLQNVDEDLKSKKLAVSAPDWEDRAECNVSGTLALTFHLCQLLAVAPVSFRRRRGLKVVTVSGSLCIVGYIFMSVLNAAGMAGLLLDLNAPSGRTIRIPATSTGKMLWLADFAMVMVIASIATYGAPNRVREIIRCLDKVQQIKRSIGNRAEVSVWVERKKYAVFILFLSFSTIIVVSSYARIADDVLHTDKSVTTLVLYAAYDTAYIMLFLLELQFAFSTLEVCDVLSALNDALEKFTGPGKKSVILVHSKLGSSKTSPETVHRLTSTYAIIFDVIKQLDTANGLSLVMLLFSCLLHLVITPNSLIYTLTSPVLQAQRLTLEVFWCVLHLVRTVLLIEPPHMTLAEIERTHQLVSNLTLLTTEDVETEELDKFYKYLTLNKIEYSPLGICSMMRSLLPSMMGSVATYLVIVIQFQALEYGSG